MWKDLNEIPKYYEVLPILVKNKDENYYFNMFGICISGEWWIDIGVDSLYKSMDDMNVEMIAWFDLPLHPLQIKHNK